MIVCPNCSHQNPDGAVQCEACYTPLPAMTACPNCGAAVQTDASFCGQCGFNLRSASVPVGGEMVGAPPLSAPEGAAIPDLVPPDPLIAPDPLVANAAGSNLDPSSEEFASAASVPGASTTNQPNALGDSPSPPPAAPKPSEPRTQLQQQTARLLHVQTNTSVELPQNLGVIHLGKPNDRVPPDIDISGFPNSEIVSRIHADIRVEGDNFYIEDVGSSNGTYINNAPLALGNRHRLRSGDRIALGKGDKVTFLFQLT